MRTNKDRDMVLLQTTIHKSVHGWLVALAAQEGLSVASLVRNILMKRWSVAPDVPGQRPTRIPPAPVVDSRKRSRGKKGKPKSDKQLALPGTARTKRARKPKREAAQ